MSLHSEKKLVHKRRGGRDPVDAGKKLLQLLNSWAQEFWPDCVGADECSNDTLRQQGEAWLLDQIERWEVDSSPSRNHKLKFFGGRTVARWASVWSSGVDLVARYKQARLEGKLPETQRAAEMRQDLLERLSTHLQEDLLAKAERREVDLLQQLKEIDAKIDRLADVVRQSQLDEQAAWQPWLSQPVPDTLDIRKRQASTSGIHRQAMEQTEQARRKHMAACNRSMKALDKQADLRVQYDLAVVERQLLQFEDSVVYQPKWDRKDPKTPSTIPGGGRGIFAARSFVEGEFIGRYLGKLLGLSGTFTEAVLKPVMYSLQAYQSQYLLTFRAPGRHGRNIVIDAALPTQSESEQRALTDVIVFEQTSWSWPGTFVHLANDGRHGQRTNRCNTKMQTRGHVVATRPIPSLDTNDPDWASSEILWDYTDGYWREVPESL